MKMQDKLVKFNHKAPYYRMKKCAVSFAIFIGMSVSVAIPVSLNIATKAPVPNNAETDNSSSEVTEVVDPNENEVAEDEELLSY